MKRLLVNADDFGLAAPVTDGILDAWRSGIVTSTSILVTGEDARRAAELARAEDGLAVGVHLSLVAARPRLPPAEVPSLVDRDGRFPPDHRAVARRWVGGAPRIAEVERELRAQIVTARGWGIVPTHLDSDQHLHLLPGIFALTARLAGEFSVPRIRVPAGGYREALPFSVPLLVLEILARRARRQLEAMANGPRMCEHFRGRRQSCRLTREDILRMLETLPEGTTELMCHPGRPDARLLERHPWGRNWHHEREALKSPAVREKIRELGVELVARLT